MHRTEGANNVANFFANGPPGTRLEEDWLNAVQEEIAYVIEQEGIVLKTAVTETSHQLDEALRKAFAPIPSGTIMLFGQTTPPVGWTRKGDWQDNAMLCYAAAGAIGSGGGVDPQATHTHTGPSHTHTGPSHTHTTGDHTLIVAEMPAHVHGILDEVGQRSYASGADIAYYDDGATSASAGGGGAHNHGATGADGTGATGADGTGATGANGVPHYQEVIAAQKD